jgi:hypothetical protein
MAGRESRAIMDFLSQPKAAQGFYFRGLTVLTTRGGAREGYAIAHIGGLYGIADKGRGRIWVNATP